MSTTRRQNLEAHLSRAYDLSLGQYEAALSRQHGVCFVCGEPPKSGQRLQVDHDHHTHVMRALLCGKCNSALGLMREEPALLRRLASYAERCLADRAAVQADPDSESSKDIRAAFKRRSEPPRESLKGAFAVFHRADGMVSTDGVLWRFP